MIVTRTRKKRLKIGRWLVSAALIALIAVALRWQPSHDRLHAVAPIGKLMDTVATAFDAGSLHQAIGQRDRQIARLQRQIASLQSDVQSREKQISALTTQVDQLGEQLAAAPQTPPSRTAGAQGVAPGRSAPSLGDAAQIERTAKIWDDMDPEAAAKIAQRLPDAYVARVFAKMQADQVAEILGAMPPKIAARLQATR